MTGPRFSPSRTLRRDISFSNVLMPRASTCATCSDTTPSCPTCPSGQSCTVTVPLTCYECPKAYCTKDLSSSASSSQSSAKSNTGAIAGGIIGGLALIGIVTYLIWRFCIKTKRSAESSKLEEDGEYSQQMDAAAAQSFTTRRDQRASTHTVHSIASTVLTRASNIIQIAYIPGVTNRAPPTSPNVLVPPVPPIPVAHGGTGSAAGSPAGTEEQHFFVPGDLRDSTYSGYSAYTDRTSYARTSYAPRSSIASTIYGKNAVITAPQTGMRIKPTMVNLKSPNNLSPNTFIPPLPSVDYDKYRPVSAANSTFSVGSTFLNNASTAMPVRPVVVRVGTGSKKAVSDAESGDESPASAKATDEAAAAAAAATSPKEAKVSSPLAQNAPVAMSSGTPDQGPFSDPPSSPSAATSPTESASPSSPAAGQRNTALSAVIEEATRRASQRDSKASAPSRGRSPFGDENATSDI